MTAAGSNRRIRLTRTSGGVGGCRGAIPVTRPDHPGAAVMDPDFMPKAPAHLIC